MILLKFTFTHGIELVIAALLLSFVVIWIIYKLGDKQYKKDYEKKYNYMKLLVEDSDDKSPLMKKEIKRRFDEISTYSCKDYEKLQVLERAFIQKFSVKKMQEQKDNKLEPDFSELLIKL